MKKALAFLLPLALLVSSVSCSNSSNNSESVSNGSAAVSDTSSSAVLTNPAAEGTNYTKGFSQDNVYINEYGGIRMNIPDDLRLATDTELKSLVDSSLSYYTDGKDKSFEEGSIWDGWVTNDGNLENIFIRFVNTKVAFPGKNDVTPDDVLDIIKERNDGSTAKYEDRIQVTMGGKEYTREVYGFEASQFDLPYSNYLYARRVDDDLICLISVSTVKSESTTDYIESLFN